MANQKNIEPYTIKSTSVARERGRKGGIASGKSKKETKLFKEEIEKQLGGSLDKIVSSLIKRASHGDVKASEFLRDTVGQKPIEQIQNVDPPKINDDL